MNYDKETVVQNAIAVVSSPSYKIILSPIMRILQTLPVAFFRFIGLNIRSDDTVACDRSRNIDEQSRSAVHTCFLSFYCAPEGKGVSYHIFKKPFTFGRSNVLHAKPKRI